MSILLLCPCVSESNSFLPFHICHKWSTEQHGGIKSLLVHPIYIRHWLILLYKSTTQLGVKIWWQNARRIIRTHLIFSSGYNQIWKLINTPDPPVHVYSPNINTLHTVNVVFIPIIPSPWLRFKELQTSDVPKKSFTQLCWWLRCTHTHTRALAHTHGGWMWKHWFLYLHFFEEVTLLSHHRTGEWMFRSPSFHIHIYTLWGKSLKNPNKVFHTHIWTHLVFYFQH